MKSGSKTDSEPVMEWDSKVLMYTNPLILKQLFGALGASFLIVYLILLLATGFDPEMIPFFFGMLMLFLFICLLAFAAMAIMGGYYLVHNTLGEKSFVCETQRSRTRLMKLLCAVGFFGGMSQGNYTLAGSSALAASRLKEEMKWKDVTSVTYNPKRRYIYVKTGLFAPLAIFCNPDNYDAVEAFVREHTQPYLDKIEAEKAEAKAQKGKK
jgi:ABC-type multidrug transport system fused ATPase/permease subunit